MNTKTIATRSIPLSFLTKRAYTSTIPQSFSWRALNGLFIVFIALALFIQVILVNYLNTASLRLQKLTDTEAALTSDISELNAIILESESLDVITERANALGMSPDGRVMYISTDEAAYVKR